MELVIRIGGLRTKEAAGDLFDEIVSHLDEVSNSSMKPVKWFVYEPVIKPEKKVKQRIQKEST